MKFRINNYDFLKKACKELLNSKNIDNSSFPERKVLQNIFADNFSDYSLDGLIQINFVNENYIQLLNSEYREKDSPTDVLSFEMPKENKRSKKGISNASHSKNIIGEVYVSPDYIYNELNPFDFDLWKEEIVRVSIHGVLHLMGYDHSGHIDFGEESKSEEQMYKKTGEDIENYFKIIRNQLFLNNM